MGYDSAENDALNALVPRLRARDEEAFQQMVEGIGPALIEFAARMLTSRDAAQDVVQEVFYKIWQLGERFEPSGSLQAYLFAAVRNRALNVLQHEHIMQRSQAQITNELVNERDAAYAPVEDMEEWTRHVADLRRAFATLTEH